MDPDQVVSEAVLLRLHDLHLARQASPTLHDMTEPGMRDAVERANREEANDPEALAQVSRFLAAARRLEGRPAPTAASPDETHDNPVGAQDTGESRDKPARRSRVRVVTTERKK